MQKAPSARPISSGATLVKNVYRAAGSTKSGKRVKAGLQPIQLGLSSRAGPEKMVMIARVLNELGWAINVEDVINAFNSYKRQALLDAIRKKWVEAVALINKMYAFRSPVIYIFVADDGRTIIQIIWSACGTRQGCVFGSIGFDIVMDDIYTTLQRDYPEFVIRALTDDMPVFIPPPADGEWEPLYSRLGELLRDYDRMAAPLGIHRHPDKGHLLLPVGAPLPKHTAYHGITIRPATTIKLSGGHIGALSDIAAPIAADTDIVVQKVRAISALGQYEPQMTVNLLRVVSNSAQNYMARITPPCAMAAPGRRLDDALDEAIDFIKADFQGEEPPTGPARTARGRLLYRLNTAHGGAGITPMAWKGPAAFLASFLTCTAEPVFRRHRKVLADHVR